jgi:ribosomal protein S18 acetylase RimI-like enzyme
MILELRSATEADRDWLFALDRATMSSERESHAARASFDRHFDPSHIDVIVAEGKDCGVLRVEERDEDLYIAVLEIAPAMQGHGIGSAVIASVLDRAASERRSVALRVHAANERARALYERLGFDVTRSEGAKLVMRYDKSIAPAG